MKRLLAKATIVGEFLVLVPFCVRAAESTKTEADGTWEATRYNEKGKDNEEVVKSNFVVKRDKGSQTIWKQGKVWRERKYSVNPKATPKEMTWRDPKDGKVTAVGIYEIVGDTMTVAAYAADTKYVSERPKDFKPSEDKIVVTYRRVTEK